jgi:hypothetical protein
MSPKVLTEEESPMWTSLEPFMEAEQAYRRERIIASFPRQRGDHTSLVSRGRSSWRRRPHLFGSHRRSVAHVTPAV